MPLNKISGVHTSLEHMCGIYSAQEINLRKILSENSTLDIDI